jgi:hypothetical protein
MTAVMRAVSRPLGDKVLRVALVRGGRVIDERVLARGEHLTVGPTERNTFVIPALAASARLVEWTRGGYRVHVVRGAEGRIAGDGGARDLRELGRDGPIPIGEDARGKIAIGDALVLFHFVAPIVAAPRPALPLAVKQGLLGDADWRTTIIAAFSFLFHFGAVGSIYSDWGDEVVDDGVRIASMLPILREPAPALPRVEDPKDEAKNGEPSKSAEAATRAAPSKGGSNGGAARGGAGTRGGGGERPGDVRAREIARQLDEMDGAMTLAIGGAGNKSIGRVLETGETPLSLLESIAADARGSRAGGPPGLNLGSVASIVKPGSRSSGLPTGDPGPSVNLSDTGKQAAPKKPIASTTVAPPELTGGRVPNAGGTIASLKGMLKACYKRALDEDPTMRGTVRVTATLAPNGDVRSVQAANNGLSSGMVGCVTGVVRGAQFEAPEGGGGAVLVIPMTFIPQ